MQNLKEISSQFSGSVWFKNDAEYEKRRRVFNKAINTKPFAIIEVRHTEDVCLAVRFASQYKLSISVKGGGHSTAGSCIVADGLVLDMSSMQQIHFLSNDKLVTILPGVINRQLDYATTTRGRVVPLGTCPDVGVVGAALGGGIGFLSRIYGLTCDNIELLTMVDARAQIVNIDRNNHADLFWALRGAGGCQFGVITEMTLRTHPVPQNMFGGIIEWPISHCKEILKRYSEFVLKSPKHCFLYAYISHATRAEAKISLMGYTTAGESESQRLFAGIASWMPGAAVNVGIKSYQAIQSNTYEDGLSVYWKNGFIENTLTPELIDDIITCFNNCPEDGGGIMLDPLGGAIAQRGVNETAFLHRGANFICSITGLTLGNNHSELIQQWVHASHKVLQRHYNDHSYQNYEDLECDEAWCYFGKHGDKLKRLKAQYDPDNIFYGSLARSLDKNINGS